MTAPPVLYVEDEEDDVFFMQLGFRDARLPYPLQIAKDGKQAVDYLAGAGPYADRSTYPLPCLVLLDLNLPVLSGFEVLEWLRRRSQFQALPVIVFSASSQESDKQKAEQLGASEFVTKPSNMVRLGELLERLRRRWLDEKKG